MDKDLSEFDQDQPPEDRTHALSESGDVGTEPAESEGDMPSDSTEEESPPKMGKGVSGESFTSVDSPVITPPEGPQDEEDADNSETVGSDSSADSPGLFSGIHGDGSRVHEASIRTPFTREDPRGQKHQIHIPRELTRDKKGQLQWDGLPYEGVVGNYKSTDPDEYLPQLVQRVHTDIFEMDNVKDREKYSTIVEKTAIGHYVMIREDRRPNKAGAWTVLLTWADQKYVAPTIERI